MTEDHHKQLAAITLLNHSMIVGLSSTCSNLFEQLLPLMPDKDVMRVLLSTSYKIQESLNNTQPYIEQLKRELEME